MSKLQSLTLCLSINSLFLPFSLFLSLSLFLFLSLTIALSLSLCLSLSHSLFFSASLSSSPLLFQSMFFLSLSPSQLILSLSFSLPLLSHLSLTLIFSHALSLYFPFSVLSLCPLPPVSRTGGSDNAALVVNSLTGSVLSKLTGE